MSRDVSGHFLDKIIIDPIEFTFSQHALEHWSILVGPEAPTKKMRESLPTLQVKGEISQKQRHPKAERLEP